ncbi:MAG: hypothetical protein HYR84_00600 [Planctomycetes bacterium]|nr:hypothetical protein [Planctomycetota bacterium]
MSTKERIKAVIDTVAEDKLDDLYKVVSEFAVAQNGEHNPGIMERLLAMKKFDGPPDFAENLDQYMSGEKSLEDNIR